METKTRGLKIILLLIPNVGFGGAERVFHDHSVELGKKFKVIECVFNTEGDKAYKSNNQFISLDVPGGGGVISKIKNFVLRCQRLKKVKEAYQVDACVSHLEGADYINLITKGTEKVILCIHGSKIHDKNIRGFLGWLRKKVMIPLLYNRADKIITVSRDINAELTDKLGIVPAKVQTINNFFDLDKVRCLASEPLEPVLDSLFSIYPILITSGRLALQKNQLPLLEIFASLKKVDPTVRLVIIGDGELRQMLVEVGEKLGLNIYRSWEKAPISAEFDVFFLGYQSNPFKFLAKADIFVFPSSWEGFPMALSEAMICGLPIVSADCPTGPREILSPAFIPTQQIVEPELAEFGILMPLLQKEETSYEVVKKRWVNTLNKVLKDENMRSYYAKQSRVRINDFSRYKIIDKWVALLNK